MRNPESSIVGIYKSANSEDRYIVAYPFGVFGMRPNDCRRFIVIDAVSYTQIFPDYIIDSFQWNRNDVIEFIKNRNLVKED